MEEAHVHLIGEKIGVREGTMWELNEYTGNGDPLGFSTVYNSGYVPDQLAAALLLSSHPIIKDVLAFRDKKEKPSKVLHSLLEDKALTGIKILDLGCGFIPSFARCARAFGGDVYTLDVIPASEFEFGVNGPESPWSKGFTQRERDIEIKKHIQANLDDPEIVNIITYKAGADFDLVTSAHTESGGCVYQGREYQKNPREITGIAMKILKRNGIYYAVNNTFKAKE